MSDVGGWGGGEGGGGGWWDCPKAPVPLHVHTQSSNPTVFNLRKVATLSEEDHKCPIMKKERGLLDG